MSKLSFRARALDASKPMPIYMSEELPDLPDYSAINRAVPQMPSGMEKEEECEHHLQRAICTGLIIPTPEVNDMADAEAYDKIYPMEYKLPRQLIHMQPFAMEQDIPDYDMDSEDERWINVQSPKMEITHLKFEEMMDRLEKGSGQTVISLHDAKSLLKDDDDLIIAVYDYWLNKRLKTQRPLIPTVKTEHRLGSVANNPYLAFRRRTEKMQTRKNRKNDETSYEKMLKLRRDLSRAVTLLELVKRREKTKREHLHLTIEVYEKRYQAADFSGQMLAEVSALKAARPAFAPIFTNQFGVNHQNWPNKVSNKDEVVPRKEKRQYKKRKHKTSTGPSAGLHSRSLGGTTSDLLSYGVSPSGELLSSEEESELALPGTSPTSQEEEESDPAEGLFAFRRNKYCNYHAPLSGGLGNWPWCSREEGGLADRRYRYCLTSLTTPQRKFVGFARRRVGRGGRMILDRASTSMDELFSSLDFTVLDSATEPRNNNQFLTEVKNDWLHFRPKTPPPLALGDTEDGDLDMRDDPLQYGLTSDPSAVCVDVETLADDVFAATSDFSSELNLADLLANTSPMLEFSAEESLELLERLGTSTNSLPEEIERLSGFEQLAEASPDSVGCSKFMVHPSGRLNVVDNLCPPPTVPHHHRKRHRHRRSSHPYPTPPNLSLPPLASLYPVVSNTSVGVSNGGVVYNHEPSTSGSEAFLGVLGGSGGTSGLHGLTNGPASVEQASSSRSRPGSGGSRSVGHPQVNCLPSGPSNLPQQRVSSGYRGNMAQYGFKLPVSSLPDLPPIHIKQELPDEVTLNSGEGLDADDPGTDTTGHQVCVEKQPLVGKTNSLPMEVT